MKNFKKLITVLLSTLMLVTMIAGCGKKTETPEKFAEAFHHLTIYGDTSALTSLGLNDEEANTLNTQLEQTFKDAIKNNLNSAGLSFTDDNINNIFEAQLNAQKRTTCTIEPVSSDAETAVVKIKTTHVDIVGLDEKAANDAMTEVQNMNITDRKTALNKLSELYISKLIENCTGAEPSSDTVENTFAFKKVTDDKNRKVWVPDNPVTFGNKLATMVTR
ncbi:MULTISPECIES: DUF5105 domain-containing protein [Clostridium]|uniref:DUF5105 domain-containing protein n=1 Tax=Clostridium aquiflavi TaxID=3073603 RepID=A0ABU1EIJ4_9CLOT|nr:MULTISPECIES: DUF5105 domain-containing protein [unclassified Clostridium]MDR5587784.1 DUF5105 domain-containing protein [Clostridium sp. 5N-1]NFG62718.1 DUF5105 domain-containing protein [Clostridium botulinum]NFQ10834.1 DUF5105 domain-containing protein [Clostridium botulinum]